MSGPWVAGSVRAQSMARHRTQSGSPDLGTGGSLADALEALAVTTYGHAVPAELSLEAAQRAVAASLLWDLRVLAGWLPRAGVRLMQALAGWFEIANIDEIVERSTGRDSGPLFDLGALATAGRQVSSSADLEQLRIALAASPWGDPRAGTPQAIRTALRVQWAVRVAVVSPVTRPWACGGLALLMARECVVARRRLPAAAEASARRLLPAAVFAGSGADLEGFCVSLPADARWVLDGLGDTELWRAEGRWWTRVERDGLSLLRSGGFGPDLVTGAVAVLAGHAWRVQASLSAAASGAMGLEVLDALA